MKFFLIYFFIKIINIILLKKLYNKKLIDLLLAILYNLFYNIYTLIKLWDIRKYLLVKLLVLL